MSMLLFLKPHYRRTTGWLPSLFTRGKKGRKRRRKRIFKVEFKGSEATATPVNYKDVAVSLAEEIKVIRIARNKRRARDAVVMIQLLLEEE